MEFFHHHGVWAPGVRLFRNLQFAAKATLISAIFLLPVLLLGTSYLQDKAAAIEFSAKERHGVVYTRAVMPLLDAVLKPGTSPTAGAPAALQEVERELGAELGTAKQHAAAVKAVAGGGAEAAGAALIDLLTQVSDGSNLTLDPDIDSYYIMDAVMFRVGPMKDLLARMRTTAAQARGADAAAPAAQRELRGRLAVFEYHVVAMRDGLAKSVASNASLAGELQPDAALRAAEAVVAAGQQALQGGEGTAARWAAFDAAAAGLDKELPGLTTRMLTALDGLLATRVGALQRQRTIVIVAVVSALAMAIYLFISFFLVTRGGMREVRWHLAAMTRGDLTTDPRPWGKDEAAMLMVGLTEMQTALRAIVSQVRSASDNLVTSSAEIASGAMDLHQRTEQAAARLQESASAMEEVSSVVQNTAGGAREAAQIAVGNADVAARGGQIIGSMVETMRAIHASSTKIGEIIATIDSIAFQTNILALNAAVESARAGESGRGFAVVASEVRALALRTAGAASEIKALITTSTEQVQQAHRIVGDAGSAIGEIVGSAERMNSLLSEISVGTQEQAQGVTQTTQSVHRLDTLTQANSALVEQTAAAASSLKDQAHELAQRVAAFKLPALA